VTPLEQKVVQRVASMTGEMVEFLRQLTAIPTINPPGENYLGCAEFVGARLREFGYETCYIAAAGRPEHTPRYPRVNVIGRMDSGGQNCTRPLLHFNGHFDVVPAGAGWTVDPFAGTVRDGKIFGRGTTDQKAGIAASIFAVEAIRREGVALHGTVEQSATVDEESGGFAGVAYLAEHGYIGRDRTDYVIITEPLGVDSVCLGHRGVYWFRVTTLGQAAHGSMPFLGVNAISKMAEVVSSLERDLQPRLALRHTSMPVEPPAARCPSLNVNSIFGGQAGVGQAGVGQAGVGQASGGEAGGGQPGGGIQTPCVADRCEAIFDRRFLAEEPIADVKGEIASLLEEIGRSDPQFRYQLDDLMTVLPVHTDAASILVRQTAGAVRDVLGTEPRLISSPGTYDQKHVMRVGLVEQCIAYGPGILHLSHQPDEYCRIDHLVAGAQTMALAAMRLLSAE
jgi:succinyl-diaminopimelate desuccinylase